MKIRNFSNVLFNNQLYGGRAGQKLGFNWNDSKWFLKFPKSTKSMNNVNISYTTAPLSEYIGSHIYLLIGLPVHDTELGIYDQKLVVACKDFKERDENLFDFHSIKNLYSLNDLQDEIPPSSSHNLQSLEEINMVFKNNEIFKDLPELKERFWDMFVIDALIGNHDRNNGNWGILVNSQTSEMRIAPVYDNGAAFGNKLDDEKIKDLLNDEHKFKQNVYESRISSFSLNDKNINPLKYIESMSNSDLNKAVLRIVPKINKDKIFNLIDEIPSEDRGIRIISDVQKEFYKKTLDYRYEKVLEPVFNKLLEIDKDNGSETQLEKSTINDEMEM